MKKLFILFVIFLGLKTNAQVNFEWAKQIGGTGSDGGVDIANDSAGNVYVCGEFTSTVDFDPGPSVQNLTAIGQSDGFIMKLNSSGNLIWVKQIGTPFYSTSTNDLVMDEFGNPIIIGRFWGSVDFNPGPGTFNLTSAGFDDIFILKLDSSGNFLWAKNLGGTLEDTPIKLNCDINSNILVTGQFNGTADFNPGPLPFNLTSSGFSDIFISKLDVNGNFLWAKRMGGSGYDQGRGIVTDTIGNIYTVGTFQNTVDFNPGAGAFSFTSAGAADVFIQKLDSLGNFVWAKRISGTNAEQAMDIKISQNQHLYIVGRFEGTTDFDPGILTYFLSTSGIDDAFMVKLDLSGNFIWAKAVGGINSDRLNSLSTDQLGNLYCIGNFQNIVDFDPGSNSYSLTSIGAYDIFILKLDSNGNFTWVKQMGGNLSQIGYSICKNTNGEIYSTGVFESTTDFDPGNNVFNLSSNLETSDIFIQKLNECLPSQYVINQSACNTYSWNNQTYAQSGIYTQQLTNAQGCDSIVSLNLTITSINTPLGSTPQVFCGVASIADLTASGSNIQWYSAPSGGLPLATSLPLTNGTVYYATQSLNSCESNNRLAVTVNLIPLPTVSAGNDQTICLGASVTLSGTGATTYSWNNGISNGVAFTPSATNTYTVTGTNTTTGCTNTDQVLVTVNPLPTVSAGTDQTICSGASVTLSGTGATTYSWNNGVSNGVAFTPSATDTYTVTGTNTTTGCMNTDQVLVTVNPLPTVSAGNDQTSCWGASVTLSGTGATTYSWNNGISNGVAFTPSATNTYTVTGTNTTTGCTNTDQVLVTVNPLPTVSAGTDQTICSGASVTLSVTGATTYSWNNGISNGVAFTPSATNTYTVTGINTITGCSNTDQVLVTVNPLPTVSAGTDQTICSGASVTLSGTGANSYSWNNGVSNGVAFTPSATNTYSVTGTNTTTGCTNTDQVLVTVNPLPTVSAGTDQTICSGASVTLSGTGATTYSWNNGVSNGVAFTPSATNTYTVTGTDINNCQNTDNVIVIVSQPSSSFQTESALDSYTWPVNGQTYTQSGIYSATIPNVSGCDSTITLNLTLNFSGIVEIENAILIVYPNPTENILTIEVPEKLIHEKFTFLDFSGRTILEGKFSAHKNSIDVSRLSKGTFLLKVNDQLEIIKITKL